MQFQMQQLYHVLTIVVDPSGLDQCLQLKDKLDAKLLKAQTLYRNHKES